MFHDAWSLTRQLAHCVSKPAADGLVALSWTSPTFAYLARPWPGTAIKHAISAPRRGLAACLFFWLALRCRPCHRWRQPELHSRRRCGATSSASGRARRPPTARSRGAAHARCQPSRRSGRRRQSTSHSDSVPSRARGGRQAGRLLFRPTPQALAPGARGTPRELTTRVTAGPASAAAWRCMPPLLRAGLQRGADERPEERVRLLRPRLELGVKLASPRNTDGCAARSSRPVARRAKPRR